ncbi:SRPBCC family protein [Ekhidna sp.]|uniref:SRPBCC family protein n=1 Tax=Ekhidna sp. TaxID=2608089 RepID=UPI003298D280
MKKRIETNHTLNASLDQVWNNVRTGAEWERWLPILSGSTIDGEGKGAKRVCKMHDGNELFETILESDDKQKIFQYQIDKQSFMPISDVIGTMKFTRNNEETKLEWTVEFEVENEEIFAQVKPGIEEIYTTSSQKLAELSK